MAARTGLARKAAEGAKGGRWCLGDAYEPHLRSQDVRSGGRKGRPPYRGRVVHLFSDLEMRAFSHFEWEQSVFGIEEQYYLEVDETVRIAAEAGAKHPLVIGTQEPHEMTTDLVVYFRAEHGERRLARQIKYSKDLELGLAKTDSERRQVAHILEKLEIERRYWDARGVNWAVLTERELSEVRQMNIEFLLGFKLDGGRPDGFWQGAVDRICHAIVAGDGLKVIDLQREMVADGVLGEADFADCFAHLCASRQLVFDMEENYSLLRPVSDFEFAPEPMKRAA